MSNFSINNGGVNTNKEGLPSIDTRFGPYESEAAAYAELGPNKKDVITAGLTVGIIQSNGSIKEFWYQPSNTDSSVLELVEKQSAGIVSGQGIITTADNALNAMNGKTFVTTQEEFDNLLDSIDAGESVDAVLGAGEFIAKKKISVTNSLKLVGSDGTVIKGDNRIYHKCDGIAADNLSYAIDISKERKITPFCLFVDGANNILPLSEYNDGNPIIQNLKIYKTTALSADNISSSSTTYDLTTGSTAKDIGDSMDIVVNPNETYNYKYFLLPADNISIEQSSLKNVFGFFEANWGTIPFQLTGDIENLTIDGVQHQYYIAQTLIYTIDSSSYSIDSNANRLYNIVGYNQYVLINVPKEGNLWYDKNYIHIPNGISSVEIVEGMYSEYTTNWLFDSNLSDKFFVSGITFNNFKNVFNFKDPGVRTATNNGFNITGCTFNNVLGYAIKAFLATTEISNKETSYINGCKFYNCGYSHYTAVSIQSDLGCYETGIKWAVIENCLFHNYTDDVCHYKNSRNMQLRVYYADALIKGCEVINSPRCGISVSKRGVEHIIGNHIWNTKNFLANKRNLQMDGGLLYIGGQETHSAHIGVADGVLRHSVIVEDNIIHGTRALAKTDIRGIYIDDGKGNVTCTHNIVYDMCASAYDSRRVNNYNVVYCYKHNDDKVYMLDDDTGYIGNVYIIDNKGLENTEVVATIESGTITYNGEVYTYSSYDNLNYCSIGNVCSHNVFEGGVRLQGGEDIPEEFLPVYSDNLILGIRNIRVNDEYNDNTSVDRQGYSTEYGINVSEYDELSIELKKLVSGFYASEESFPEVGNVKTYSFDAIDNTLANHRAHLITFDYSEFDGNDSVTIEFVSIYRPYSYKLKIGTTATSIPDRASLGLRLVSLEGGSGYNTASGHWYCELISAALWVADGICYVAVWCDALTQFRNMQGGTFRFTTEREVEFTVRYPKTIINNDVVSLNSANSETIYATIDGTNNKLQVKQVLCELPYYCMFTITTPRVDTNAIIGGWIPTSTEDEKMTLQTQNRVIPVKYSSGSVLCGLLTPNGIYNTRGTTLQRPSSLGAKDNGIQYFDETLGKFICWLWDTGTSTGDWCNLDGSSLN